MQTMFPVIIYFPLFVSYNGFEKIELDFRNFSFLKC